MKDKNKEPNEKTRTIYDENPYFRGFELETKQVIKKIKDTDMKLIDNGKEVSGKVILAHEREQDNTNFIKIYLHKNGSLPIEKLSRGAFLILCYILFESLKYERDSVEVARESLVARGMSMGRSNYAECINELINFEILARHTINELYWINPKYLFRGSINSFLNHKDKRKFEVIEKQELKSEPNGKTKVDV